MVSNKPAVIEQNSKQLEVDTHNVWKDALARCSLIGTRLTLRWLAMLYGAERVRVFSTEGIDLWKLTVMEKDGLRSRDFRTFVSGALAGATSKTITAPIETVRTRLIVGVGPKSISGSLQEVFNQHGWRGLWRGNGINAFRSAPLQAIELSTFESVKRCIYTARKRWALEGPPEIDVLGQVVKLPVSWVSPSMLAGAVAGVVSTISCYPLEVLKDRFTVHTGAYRSIWHAFGKIVHEEGVGALYRGLAPTMVGLVPYTAAYYFVYDSLTHSYRRYSKKDQLDSLETLFIGAFAGLASSAATFPFEVVRKRMMVGAVVGKRTPHNFGHTIQLILEEEGVRGLYKGIAASSLKVMPASGLSWMFYEKCKQLLHVDNNFQT